MAALQPSKEPIDEFDIASTYGLNKQLFIAILRVESGLDHTAVNPVTLDYGIAQINHKTADAYSMDIQRLTHDRAYSIEMGAKVLADFKRFKPREPDTWFCRFNVGTGPMTGKTAYQCEIYVQRVTAMMGGQ